MPFGPASDPYVPGKGYTRKKRRQRKPKRKEVTGPYRSQSSVPSIRKKATKREHRKVPPRKTQRAERKAVRQATALLRDVGVGVGRDFPNPQVEYSRARIGIMPSSALRREHPRAYRKAEKAFVQSTFEKESLKEDPLAELVIGAAATAGLGTVAGALGKAGARLLSSGAKAGEKALERTAKAAKSTPKRKLAQVRSAPKRAARRIKETPKRVRTAPHRAKRAVATKEGRRTATRGAARSARRHPVRSTYGATAASPVPLPGDADERARALLEGTVRAVGENPLGTAGATGRGLAGIVTAPIALGAAAVKSAAAGSAKPLEKTATEQFEGTVDLGKKLLSGDTEKVRKTVEHDVGLSFLAPIPAATRLKAYRRGRGKIRARAQDLRRVAAKKTRSRRIRVAPKGVESHVFRATENRAARRRVAKRVQRTTNPYRSQAAYRQREVLKHLRKAPRTRSLRNIHGMEAGDLIQTLAEYGIRSPEDVKFVREHGPVGETPKPGRVTLKSALDFAEKHPEILRDKHFKRALDAYVESTRQLPAAKAGKGRRARIMAQGDLFGVLRPEDRVPAAARPHTSAKTRIEAWKEAARRENELKAKRREGRKLATQAQVLRGKERQRARGRAEALYREAKALEAENRALVKALRPYSRPGQKLRPSARRRFYDKELLREYEAEVAAARSRVGLAEPAWTHHTQFREAGDIGPRYPTAAARAEQMRSGSLAEHDLVDRSLRALMSGSIVGPRLRAGGQELARRFTEEEMLPVKLEGKTKHLITPEEWTKVVEAGQYDPRHYVLFPARQFKQAFLDPFRTQADLAGLAGKALEKGLREKTPGNKYVVMRREAAKEFQAQISPEHWAGEQLVNAVSKGASRWLLFSPAWIMIQSVAEAVPMAMAHPNLLNPARTASLERSLRKSAKLTPDEAKAFAATAGEAPGALHTARDYRPELDSNPHGIFSDGARALTKNRIGQALWSTARLRPFVAFDSWRQGKYRELLLAAEADKALNGWYAGLKETLKIERRISDGLKGLPRHEQFAALTKPRYRKELDRLANRMEAVAGNWNAFTRFERSFAPFLVFYPFIRYSLRWPLTFAKHHPVSTTVATFLSQQNAEQIEKILGRAPENPLAYAIPVYQDERGESHLLPTGQRAAPGLSAPTQSIASQQPSQALSVFNPLIGAALTGLTGVDPYTGRQAPERGKQAVNLLLATSPIARFFDLQVSEPESALGKRYEQIDPERKARSLYEPWQGLSPRRFKELENLSRDVRAKYSDPVKDIWDNPKIGEAIFGGSEGKKVNWKLLKELLRQHKASQAAADRVTAQEEQFFEVGGGDLTEEQLKALRLLQDGRILVKPSGGSSSWRTSSSPATGGWRGIGSSTSEGWRR